MDTKVIAKRKKEPLDVSQAPTPTNLLELAIQNGAGMEQLKELMDLQERWEKNQARKAFFDALTRFQTLAPVIKKNRKANIQSQKGSYSYKFADLGAIANAIREPLKECGLSYRWEFQDNSGKLKVTCFISHRDGHTESSMMEAGMDNSGYKNDIQQKGSTQTYLQRYTLIGALGLSTANEDNDGFGAPTTQQQPEFSEEEILDQWKQTVKQANTRIELNNIFVKNRRVVEGNQKIKDIFTARKNELPSLTKTTLP